MIESNGKSLWFQIMLWALCAVLSQNVAFVCSYDRFYEFDRKRVKVHEPTGAEKELFSLLIRRDGVFMHHRQSVLDRQH